MSEEEGRGRMRSPKELMEKAVEMQLGGRQPENHDDWVQLVNFWAYNVESETGPKAIQLIGLLFECPLSEDNIELIWAYQKEVKLREEGEG